MFGEQAGVIQPGLGRREERGINVEARHADDAGQVTSIGGVQADFVADEGDRVTGVDGYAIGADDAAGVGGESAGDIEREARTRQAINMFHQPAQRATDRPLQTNTK